jgi:chromosome segregation ATPase
VTLKGDKYNPSGTLEGGFNKQVGLLKTVQTFLELNKRFDEVSEALKRIDQ